MSQSEKELENELMEAGNALLSPPLSSPVPELLSLLDRVEKFLTQVEQSPSESMKKALSPSTKALIADDLLKHSDDDVKVSIASCISEITRITAPDAPYEDDQMKEVFQLIVSSFEKLDDINSRSYIKRTTILETVSKVRSCVVMLDLECDSLIAEMFQHFLRSIREHHPENVFSSMETIMTLVLEESEDISVDLLASILDFLKMQDKEVLQFLASLLRKLLRIVLISKSKGATKKNARQGELLQAVKSKGASVYDYSKVVENIMGPEAVEPSEGDVAKENMAEESVLANAVIEKPVEVAMETIDNAPPYEEVDPTTAASPKAVMSNGHIQKKIEEISAVIDDFKDEDHEANDESKSAVEPSKINAETLTVEEPAKSEPDEPEKTNKQIGRKISSSKTSSEPSEPSEPSLTEIQEEIKKPVEQIESKDVKSADSEDNVGEPPETEKESDPPVSSPTISENEEQGDTPSPSSSGSLVDENSTKKSDQTKKTDDLVQETELACHMDSKKESDTENTTEKAGVAETKSQKQTGKNTSDKGDNVTNSNTSNNEDEETAKLDTKSAKQSGKKVETVSSQCEDKKKKGQAKGTSVKDLAKTPAIDVGKKPVLKSTPKLNKDEGDVEKASKSGSKRKQSPAEEKASKTMGYGAELVGSKVKVWWPADKAYYEGVVDSFDYVKLKHKVVYIDGDIEVLKLARERWVLIDNDSQSDQGHASDTESPDESVKTPKEKKAKTNASDQGSSKRRKTESTVKKAGPSSSKSKSTPKSGQKQKDDNKSESKAKKQASKSATGKSDDLLKAINKSKDEDVDVDVDVEPTKGSSKSTPKIAKGKSPKATSSKSITNGTGKGKAASTSKEEEVEDEDEDDSTEPVKIPETTRGKSQKGAKKRKRRGRG